MLTVIMSNKFGLFDKKSCYMKHSWISVEYWGQVMHICIVNQIIICQDNGMLPA